MAELVDRITVDQEQCGGCPCIRGIRIRVSNVLNLLAYGFSPEQILEEMPDLELEGIRASWRPLAKQHCFICLISDCRTLPGP